jgi:AraC-like DNA-binding protein
MHNQASWDPRFVRAIRHLQSDTHCCLTTLVQTVHISPAYLQVLFHRHLTVSVARFGLSLRLHRAAATLTAHDGWIPIKAVQFEYGFRHAANFSKQFSRHFGVTPSQLTA